MRPIPDEAAQQAGAFTRAQAMRAGWTRSALHHAIASGALRRVRRSVYAVTSAVGTDAFEDARQERVLQAAAAVLVERRAVVSHGSAAVLWGLPLLSSAGPSCVTVSPGFIGVLDGVHLHRARLRPGDVYRRERILLTAPSRTVVDEARENGAAAGLVLADAGIRAGLFTAADLDRAVARCSGWPGVRAARAAAQLADPRAESPLESVSRLHISTSGLPLPDLQPEIYDTAGQFLGRPDFYWDEFGLVGEADGAAKYTGRDVLVREKRRQDRFEDAGLTVVRWGWPDIRDRDRFIDLLQRAAHRARRRPAERLWVVRRQLCIAQTR